MLDEGRTGSQHEGADTAGERYPNSRTVRDSCIAAPAGQAYSSGGSTIGPGLTYGYIAGLNAVKEPVNKLV